MNTVEVLEKQKISATRTMNAILADSSKQLPSRIQLIKAGRWINSVKGDIDITLADLAEFKTNFDNGVGLPGNGLVGLPVDFSHEDWKGAAFWIKAVEVEGDILWASEIEYTTKGREALESGEYKCISPSFYPACMGTWFDPENPEITARNVIVGAGLTNIPFFKGLTPIMASASSGEDKSRNVIYINADAKGDTMDLAVVRAKPVTEITDEEKAFLVEHKADLQADELVAFGIDQPEEIVEEEEEEIVVVPPVENVEDKEASEIQASIKNGSKVLVEASAYKSLQGKVDAYQKIIDQQDTEKIEASVKEHAARGAIKADQIADWTKKIKADRSLETLLSSLPDNKLVASEYGTSEAGDTNASNAINEKVLAKIQASSTPLTYADALKQVASENAELANDRQKQLKNQ